MRNPVPVKKMRDFEINWLTELDICWRNPTLCQSVLLTGFTLHVLYCMHSCKSTQKSYLSRSKDMMLDFLVTMKVTHTN